MRRRSKYKGADFILVHADFYGNADAFFIRSDTG